MKSVVVVVLALLQSVARSQTFPHVSFMGQTLANNSYVDLSKVGEDGSGSNSVQCVTDLGKCCSDTQGGYRGDWYFPDGTTKLPFPGGGDIFESREAQRVDLRRRNSATLPTGIYRCDIPTNAVHDDDNTEHSVRDTVYVGLYSRDGGNTYKNYNDPLVMLKLIGEISGMTFYEDSDLNGANPQFTLTCISTSGPATTVQWTRDSTTVTEGKFETVLTDPVTAKYTHSLTVTGRYPGLYNCTVANNKPSQASANYTVKGNFKKLCTISYPLCSAVALVTNVKAFANGLTSILVSWNTSGDANGYIIYYESSRGHNGSENLTSSSISQHILSGLQNGEIYNISILATSDHFNSERVPVNSDVSLGKTNR